MLKRIIALYLSLLVLASLSLSVFATQEETEKQLIQPLSRWEASIPLYDLSTKYAKIQRLQHDVPYHHQEAVIASKMEDLSGYCGLFASYQLYYQGINTWLKTHHGNDHFDVYSQIGTTSGGYRPYSYYLEDYTLEEALNAATKNGTFDAYNLLVCFQWTKTEEGQKYGHVVYIYAILDGIVYFTESFDTALGTKAGDLIAISIPQFVNYYSDWTTYEGTILFGKPNFLKNGYEYESDLFVKTMAPTSLLSQPCSPEAEVLNSVQLRTVATGERLKVTALYENMLGEVYYRVDEAGLTGWLPAQKAGPVLFLEGKQTAENVQLPQTISSDMTFSGRFTVSKGDVRLQLLDSEQKTVYQCTLTKKQGAYDLNMKGLAAAICKEELKEGWYSWQVVNVYQNNYLRDGKIVTEEKTAVLYSRSVSMGKPAKRDIAPPTVTVNKVKNGWVYENDTWYCYDQGTPRTGWYCWSGIDYYLKPDGSVTTGTAIIGGKERIFTATGALRTGWLESKEGTKYLLSNGVCARGWLEVDGKMYYFDPFGYRLSNCWITEASQRRYLTEDGTMASGKVIINDQLYHFDQNGLIVEEKPQTDSKPLRGSAYLPA